MSLAAMSPATSWLFLVLCLWVVVNVALLAYASHRRRTRRHTPRQIRGGGHE